MQFTPRRQDAWSTRSRAARSPAEIYRASSTGGAAVALTHLNDAVLSAHQLTPLEEFWVDGADGAQVQSFVVKPLRISRPTANIRC